MPRSRATWRCGTPSATSRRIRAQSSIEITHPICLGGLVFDRRYGLVFKRRRHKSLSVSQVRSEGGVGVLPLGSGNHPRPLRQPRLRAGVDAQNNPTHLPVSASRTPEPTTTPRTWIDYLALVAQDHTESEVL